MNRSLLRTVVFTILFLAGIQALWTEVAFKGYNIQDLAAKDSLLYAFTYDGFFSSKNNGATREGPSTFNGPHPKHILL